MCNRKLILAIGLFAIGILSSTTTLLAGELWISTKGNDWNDGTRHSPKATLTSALRQAREWRRTGDSRVQGGITIYLEGGTYSLYEPVFIRPEDSGTVDSPTVIRSVEGEEAVMSGGVHINNWKRQDRKSVV